MKTSHYLFGLFIFILGLQSCTHDTCEREVTFFRSTPVVITADEIRTGLKNEAARSLKNPGKLYFYNNYIFINERNEGVHVVDNNNPESPVNIGFVAIPGNVDIAVKGDLLYADSYVDLVTLDITNINDIKEVGRSEDVFPHMGEDEDGRILVRFDMEEITEIRDCDAANSLVNQGGVWFEVDVLFDASIQTTSPVLTNGAAGAGVGGSMARFTIADDYLYTVDNSSMHVFDLNNATEPERVSTVSIGWNIETIFPYGDHLFIGSNSGMFIYDRSTPANPSFISRFAHVTSCDPVFVKDNYAYVTLRSGTFCQGFTNQLDLIDISNLHQPVLEETFPMDNPHGLSIKDNNLFLCEGAEGIKVFDIEEPRELDGNLLERVKDIHAYDVIVVPSHDNILLAIGNDGFYQYNFDNPKRLKLLSSIPVEQ